MNAYDRPRPPITVDDNGDLEVYEDVLSACRDLEVYDVGRLAVVDSFGRRLEIRTRGFDVVDMEIQPGAESVPHELAERLRAFISRVGPQRIGVLDFKEAPLDVLLTALEDFFAEPPAERRSVAWLDALRKMVRWR